MDYEQQTWNDGVAGGTPITAERLTHMEAGIGAASDDKPFKAYAIDNTNTAVALTLGSYAAWGVGLLVSIPPTTKVIELAYLINGYVTAAGIGAVAARVVETTTGAAVDRMGSTLGDEAFSIGVYESLFTLAGSGLVEPLPVPIWRHFRLEAGVFRPSGALAAAVLASGTTRRTFLKAVA